MQRILYSLVIAGPLKNLVGEVHVFTNEADLALRLASTAANFISFPARTGFSGYRLGNLTVSHFLNSEDHVGEVPLYGILGQLILSIDEVRVPIRMPNSWSTEDVDGQTYLVLDGERLQFRAIDPEKTIFEEPYP